MTVRPLLICSLLALSTASVTYADVRSDAKAQVSFGIAVAEKGLWREALYRWERAAEIDSSYAAVWNNLGVAYEQHGLFDKAREAYEKAIDLEPNNLNIMQNYDLFREINDRIQKSR